jgi:hypothetical protein
VPKDERHGFAKKRNQDYLFDATVMFVKEYLLKFVVQSVGIGSQGLAVIPVSVRQTASAVG